MNAIQKNNFTETWRKIGERVGAPKAIITVSAHWYTHGTYVTAMEDPKTIHDFWGFPPALSEVQYPAPGSPEVAGEVVEAAKPICVEKDTQWGLDHGTWSVLRHMFPHADIPVIQVSVNADEPVDYHIELGKKLANIPGTLLVGSGNVVHNLSAVDWHNEAGFGWADRFDEKAAELISDEPTNMTQLYGDPDFARAVPTPDHFLPLAYFAGAAEGKDVSIFNRARTLGSLSMTGYMLEEA